MLKYWEGAPVARKPRAQRTLLGGIVQPIPSLMLTLPSNQWPPSQVPPSQVQFELTPSGSSISACRFDFRLKQLDRERHESRRARSLRPLAYLQHSRLPASSHSQVPSFARSQITSRSIAVVHSKRPGLRKHFNFSASDAADISIYGVLLISA